MTPERFEEMRPLTQSRAREIMAQGHDGWTGGRFLGYTTGCDGKKAWRQLLISDELFAVQRFYVEEAPGSWSFNSVIRECAR